VLQVKRSAADELTVLVHQTAEVLTLRNVKLFGHTSDSYNRDHRPGNVDGATRLDIFDVDTGAKFAVSDFGVWNVHTSVLDGATLMAQMVMVDDIPCIAGAASGAARAAEKVGMKHGCVENYTSTGPTPQRKKRARMV
jgi:hypothetical protein